MKWPLTTIGDIAAVKGGKRLPKGKLVQDEPTPYPYIRIVDFSSDGLDTSNVKYIDAEVYQKISRYTITNDDIYISIAGTVGLVGIVPPSLSGTNLTENAAKVCEIRLEVDKRYLLYTLRSPHGQQQIAAKVGGAAQPKLPLYRIKEISFPLPPLPTQRHITAILSAYDDLIENNTRRIAILEEMARRLYEEWFVHFRFPGHEDIKMVESEIGPVPEGWKVGTIEDFVELAYGKALTATDRTPGPVPVYGSSGVVGTHTAHLVEGPGIIVGRKGNVGSVHWSDVPFYPIDTVYFVRTDISIHYVYFNLQNQNFLSSDTAVPGLSRNQAYALPFVLPAENVLDSFKNHCQSVLELEL